MATNIVLSKQELSLLTTLEEGIDLALKECQGKMDEVKKIIEQKVWSRLKQIHDGRLYLAVATSFEKYCNQRWGISRSQAYREVDAADVLQHLGLSTAEGARVSPIGDTQDNPIKNGYIPTPSESQSRELARLKAPEHRKAAWVEALQTAPDGVATAAHVEQVVNRHIKEAARKKKVITRSGPRAKSKPPARSVRDLFHAARVTNSRVFRLVDQIEDGLTDAGSKNAGRRATAIRDKIDAVRKAIDLWEESAK